MVHSRMYDGSLFSLERCQTCGHILNILAAVVEVTATNLSALIIPLWTPGLGESATQGHIHTAHCTLLTAHFTLYPAHCTLHTTHYTLHNSHCTLQSIPLSQMTDILSSSPLTPLGICRGENTTHCTALPFKLHTLLHCPLCQLHCTALSTNLTLHFTALPSIFAAYFSANFTALCIGDTLVKSFRPIAFCLQVNVQLSVPVHCTQGMDDMTPPSIRIVSTQSRYSTGNPSTPPPGQHLEVATSQQLHEVPGSVLVLPAGQTHWFL